MEVNKVLDEKQKSRVSFILRGWDVSREQHRNMYII